MSERPAELQIFFSSSPDLRLCVSPPSLSALAFFPPAQEGTTLNAVGEHKEALECNTRALRMLERLIVSLPRNEAEAAAAELSDALARNLASRVQCLMYVTPPRNEEALEESRRALELYEHDFPLALVVRSNRAQILFMLGRNAEGE